MNALNRTQTTKMRPVTLQSAPLMTLRQRILRWFKRLLVLSLVMLLVGSAVLGGVYAYYSQDLPSVDELKTYRPPQVTKVNCRNGQTCAEFFVERRTWIDVKTLPKHVRDAFLAAEDADFYQHSGLDYPGIIRSALKNLKPGGMKSGASTISQQACRWLLLSQERSLSRKIREWILTPRMEKALGKDEILNLYVNSIYFGHMRYGIEEASLYYFGKHARELSLGEAAVIAGTVQAPHRINPVTNIVRAKKRQTYVLNQMWKKGFVPEAKAREALELPIQLGPRPATPVGQYYAEDVRKQLVAHYGEKLVQQGGLRVEIAMDPRLQAAAETSVRTGLEAVDRRQGYRGPVGSVSAERFATLRPLMETRLAEAGKRRTDEVLVADLGVLKDDHPPVVEEGADPKFDPDDVVDPDEPTDSPDQLLTRSIGIRTLSDGTETVGWVTSVDDAKGFALVDLIGKQARVDFKSVAWARRRDGAKLGNAPAKMSDVMAAGDLVRLRLGNALPASQYIEATIAQLPIVQGALVSINPVDRTVLAMVGGYDFNTSSFNRATQAHRQPGSSFKPFLYGTAIESKLFTPISVINDAPEAIRDQWTGKMWKPQNFEKGGFDGPITLRTALTRSKNTVSVRLIEALGAEKVIDFAHRAGLKSEFTPNLTLALGTGEVQMLEIANGYATLQNQGLFAEPISIVKVTDAKGVVLEEHRAMFEQTIAPEVAFVTTSLMRSVVEEGTAVAVLELGRPAAGKTGTAQEYRDAWFSGYTADFVTSAWVGFDDHTPIGPLETGGRAALPLWLSFMKVAHEKLPVRDFPVVPNVVQVRIDPANGRLAGNAIPGRAESFVAGTEPTETTTTPGSIDPADFLMHDSKGPR